MTGIIDVLYKRILLAAHPVGSIYQSTVSTNPAALFGGTWEAIEGRFLLAKGGEYAAGSMGGEAVHKLTTSEMPSHNHTFSKSVGWPLDNDTGLEWDVVYTSNSDGPYTFWSSTTSYAGGGQAHNNMPPYLTVYMWKRTA